MFCCKCGKKLSGKEDVCKNCGAPVEHEEYCGGFYGLVKEAPARDNDMMNAVPAPDQKANTDNRAERKEETKMKRGTVILFSVFFGVLVVAFALMTWKITLIADQQEDIEHITRYHLLPDSDGVCDVCGECVHSVTVNDVCDPEEKPHEVSVMCASCEEILSTFEGSCVDNKNDDPTNDTGATKDEKCDICGAEIKCKHSNEDYTFKFVGSHEESKHSAICNECKNTVEELEEQLCQMDSEGKCEKCGISHEEDVRYDKDSDGMTHTKVFVCSSDECDGSHTEQEDCVDIDPAKPDDEADCKCYGCERDMHTQSEKYAFDSENVQHFKQCKVCEKEISGTRSNCVDNNEPTGRCDVCDSELST